MTTNEVQTQDVAALQQTLAHLHAAEAERNRLQGELRSALAEAIIAWEQAAHQRAAREQAEADTAALRDAINQYIAADDDARPALYARSFVLQCADHPGAGLLAERDAARAVADAVAALISGRGTIAAVRRTGDAYIAWRKEHDDGSR